MGRWIAGDLGDLRHINPLPSLSTAAYIMALRSAELADPDVSRVCAKSKVAFLVPYKHVHIPAEFRPLAVYGGKKAA